QNVIHRDLKPENILVIDPEARRDDEGSGAPRVKLSDFGLARHVVETDSLNVTHAGAILGTPLYMAPEQCSGEGELGPSADVYAMGATLFHLLTGRPPFEAASALSLISMHQNARPPALREWNTSASDGVGQVIAKALAKVPEERYADAFEMLDDLDRLLRGEPTGMVIHPLIPEVDPGKLSRFDFRFELEATPRQLWPHVSNTERFNRAIGLPAIEFSLDVDEGGATRRFGHIRKSGVSSTWQEYPFEWIEGRRLGVFREFTEGPFQWFISIVELTPRAGGGTTLAHAVRIASHGAFGRA
ncbi:protein kinase domain-containing protein, partial [Singulisphaera rosea]